MLVTDTVSNTSFPHLFIVFLLDVVFSLHNTIYLVCTPDLNLTHLASWTRHNMNTWNWTYSCTLLIGFEFTTISIILYLLYYWPTHCWTVRAFTLPLSCNDKKRERLPLLQKHNWLICIKSFLTLSVCCRKWKMVGNVIYTHYVVQLHNTKSCKTSSLQSVNLREAMEV